ncbi:hypothetical protein GEMRC1_005293 [Eukaryota sp. GEM-RC1]
MIQKLTLKNCEFHGSTIPILCSLISNSSFLKFVEFDDLSVVNPTVPATIALADALKANSSIKQFVLRSTYITSKAAIAFAHVFLENSIIENIDLGLNSFDDTTITYINSVSKGNLKFT